jgi:hypothetical protein
MKKVFTILVSVAVLSASVALTRAAPPAEPTTGKVLVLDNELTLEGEIERVGNQYRVRRTVGETWWPGERVLKLCADVPAAYEFLRGRANLNDADERLRLAEWCRQHALRQQALAEVREAVRIRPQNAASRRLLEHLLQEPAPVETAAKPAPEPEMPASPLDLTADSMGLFATRVQPILMNTCAGCHASDKAGKFRLTRLYESDGLNRKILQQNLAAVLAQVNLREPRVSPLLTKSVSVHGSLSKAPLKNRQAPAYRALEDWVRLTLASNPTLHDPAGTSGEPRAATKTEEPFAADSPQPAEPMPTSTANPMPAATSVTPAKPAAPDPFDPAVFNRQAHPEKQAAPPKKP